MSDISIKTADGSFGGYLALPEIPQAPGVVVIQEIFGVNAVMRDICDSLAAQGYIAFAPDLFWRIEPGVQLTDKTEAEWQEAFRLMGLLDIDKAVEDIAASIGFLRGHERCTGKVGAIGYCLGGKLAFLTAARTDIDVSVGYYGVGLEQMTGEAAAIAHPLMLHIAELDKFCPPAAQAEIKDKLGRHETVTLHSYPNVDHAFAREGGQHYDAQAAQLANGRTQVFLRQNLYTA